MLEILEEILVDGSVSLDEVDVLRFWLEEHRDLSGVFPFDKAFNAINDVLEDGIITPEELEDLKRIFTEILDPVKAQSCRKTITSLQNIHICLSGEFNYGSKNDVKQLIIEAGGLIDNNVKKATNYLVVGAKGSDAWKTGKYGGKVQKAMEYNSKGLSKEEIVQKAQEVFIERLSTKSKDEGERFSYEKDAIRLANTETNKLPNQIYFKQNPDWDKIVSLLSRGEVKKISQLPQPTLTFLSVCLFREVKPCSRDSTRPSPPIRRGTPPRGASWRSCCSIPACTPSSVTASATGSGGAACAFWRA